VKDGDLIMVNVEAGEVMVGGKVLRGKGVSGMALEILKAGGLIEYLKRLQRGSRD
jgi:3-isopropylmalate/(R)-2-methylmalate dehydratase small subunit